VEKMLEKKAVANCPLRKTLKKIYKDRFLYFLMLPALAVTLFFKYGPMPGLVMAFQNFSIYDGLWGSEWVGLDNIIRVYSQSKFLIAIWNTLKLSLLNILINFPAPVILALLINEIKYVKFKKFVQTASYLPHFLSWMSIVGLAYMLFARDGLINDIRMALGSEERITFLSQQNLFMWFVLLIPGWKEVGWGTIIHLANIASINPELYQAAEIDGATRWQRVRYITLPHMMPMITVLFIFQMGTIFNSNFELVYGLQNPYIDFEVISTIVYSTGVKNGSYSLATALGFTQGLVALILVGVTNFIAKKTGGQSI